MIRMISQLAIIILKVFYFGILLKCNIYHGMHLYLITLNRSQILVITTVFSISSLVPCS